MYNATWCMVPYDIETEIFEEKNIVSLYIYSNYSSFNLKLLIYWTIL